MYWVPTLKSAGPVACGLIVCVTAVCNTVPVVVCHGGPLFSSCVHPCAGIYSSLPISVIEQNETVFPRSEHSLHVLWFITQSPSCVPHSHTKRSWLYWHDLSHFRVGMTPRNLLVRIRGLKRQHVSATNHGRGNRHVTPGT